jgi:hypothetical protein
MLTRRRLLDTSFYAADPGRYVAEFRSTGLISKVQINVVGLVLPNLVGRWVSIGPDASMGADGRGADSTGKIEALAFDPTNGPTLYAGSSLGGVWRSNDFGGHWVPTMDNKVADGLSVGAVTVAGDGAVYAGGLPVSQVQ